MFAGVAMGVRSAAADATLTHINTVKGESSASVATDSAMGMMIRAVAVLLISCPNTAVTMKMPMSSR